MSRKDDLQEWERFRRLEVELDVDAHWRRSLKGVLVALAVWYAVDWLDLPQRDLWHFAVALVAVVYLLGRVIVWLRLEGAYLERRLSEIEALVSGTKPSYYTRGDGADFDRNPLFERLDQIDHAIRNLREDSRPDFGDSKESATGFWSHSPSGDSASAQGLGYFEGYLQRRRQIPLFPIDRQYVSRIEIEQARQRDDEDPRR